MPIKPLHDSSNNVCDLNSDTASVNVDHTENGKTDDNYFVFNNIQQDVLYNVKVVQENDFFVIIIM